MRMVRCAELFSRNCSKQTTKPVVTETALSPLIFYQNMDDDLATTDNEMLRIMIVGRDGVGKSATGNTILGQQCFVSDWRTSSIEVVINFSGAKTVDGRQVTVIDTTALFGMDMKSVSKCMSYAAPGPHVFLLVVSIGRCTTEDKQAVQKIQRLFGQTADGYCMVLFTGGDRLEEKNIEDCLKECPDLQDLVDKCHGQYHVFNNELQDRSQVTELFQKIRTLVQRNGGSHYTIEIQEAEREIKEEMEKAKEEERQKAEAEERKKTGAGRYWLDVIIKLGQTLWGRWFK